MKELIEIIFIVGIGIFMAYVGSKIGYASGQIDALSGHQQYHFETNTVQHVTWHKN